MPWNQYVSRRGLRHLHVIPFCRRGCSRANVRVCCTNFQSVNKRLFQFNFLSLQCRFRSTYAFWFSAFASCRVHSLIVKALFCNIDGVFFLFSFFSNELLTRRKALWQARKSPCNTYFFYLSRKKYYYCGPSWNPECAAKKVDVLLYTHLRWGIKVVAPRV